MSRLISTHDRPDEDVVIGSMGSNIEAGFIAKVIAETPMSCFALDTANMLPITFQTIQDETNRNVSLKQVASFNENGWPEKEDEITAFSLVTEF